MRQTCIHTCVFFFALTVSSYGQYNTTIRTARPGQAIGPFTVGQSIFQIQSGFDYFGSAIPSVHLKSNGLLNNTVIRYGVGEKFEISGLFEGRTVQTEVIDNKDRRNGLNAFDLGGRYHIYTGKGLVPSVGVQLRVRLPLLSEDYHINHVAPRFIVATQQHLSKLFTLTTNWGASWDGNGSTTAGNYVINLGFPLGDKWGAFIETYGRLQNSLLTPYFDTGVSWLVSNDLQLDAYGGLGKTRGVKEFFISTGASWRTKPKGGRQG